MIQRARTARGFGHTGTLFRRHEHIVNYIVIAACTAHPRGLPDVDNRHLRFGNEHHSDVWLAPARHFGLAIFINNASACHHAGVMASATEPEMAADSIAAIDSVCALWGPKISGKHALW